MFYIILLLLLIGIWLALWFCNLLFKIGNPKIRAGIMVLNTAAAVVFAGGILTPLNLWIMYSVSLVLIIAGFAITMANRYKK